MADGWEGPLLGLWGRRYSLSEPESPEVGTRSGTNHCYIRGADKRLESRSRFLGVMAHAAHSHITNCTSFCSDSPGRGNAGTARRLAHTFLVAAGHRGPGPPTSQEDETPPDISPVASHKQSPD